MLNESRSGGSRCVQCGWTDGHRQANNSLYALRTRITYAYNVSSWILSACSFHYQSHFVSSDKHEQLSSFFANPKTRTFVAPSVFNQTVFSVSRYVNADNSTSNSSFQRASIQALYFGAPLFFFSCRQPRQYLPPPNTFINRNMVLCVFCTKVSFTSVN
jgi:hypothetical protein